MSFKGSCLPSNTRIRTRVIAAACALLATSAVVSAQSLVDATFHANPDNDVLAIALQADGKIVVGGAFTRLTNTGGSRGYIGRLNADGSLDTGFVSGADDWVKAVAVQADGKILLGGDFTRAWDAGTGLLTPRSHIARYNADGSLDASFDPGANGAVAALLVQPDGKILAGGGFTKLGGGGTGTTTRTGIGRLNADGSLDLSFNPGTNGSVIEFALQADGAILVGGGFTQLGGSTRRYIGRLNADGSLDTGFNPGASNTVYALAVQSDGKIVVGGYFTTLGDGGAGSGFCESGTSSDPTYARSCLGRLNADGSLDPGFDPGANKGVMGLAVQADGKILVVGHFSMLGGGGSGATTRKFLGRLNSDGTLDAGFNPGANNSVLTLAVQPDRKILVGGLFHGLGGGTGTTTCNHLGRLTFPAVPAITWASPASIAYGTALSATQLNATANVPGEFVYTPASGTVLAVGTHTLTTSFTPTDTVNYATASATTTLVVAFVVFTDDPLQSGVTPVKAVHVTELRQAIDTLRTRSGLGGFAWTDTTVGAGATLVKAAHLTELRSALNDVYAALGQSAPTYTHSTITAGVTEITALDITELRAAVLAVWALPHFTPARSS